MPKAETKLTAKQAKLSDAKIKLEKAQEADTAKSTPATVKALEDARAVYTAANAEVKRENFVRVAGSRVKKAIVAVRNLGGVNNLRTYTYSENDIAKAEAAVQERVKACFAAMRAGLTTSAAAPKEQEANLFES